MGGLIICIYKLASRTRLSVNSHHPPYLMSISKYLSCFRTIGCLSPLQCDKQSLRGAYSKCCLSSANSGGFSHSRTLNLASSIFKTLSSNSSLLALVNPRCGKRGSQTLRGHSGPGKAGECVNLRRARAAGVVVRVVQEDSDGGAVLVDGVSSVRAGLVIQGSKLIGSSEGHGGKVRSKVGSAHAVSPPPTVLACDVLGWL